MIYEMKDKSGNSFFVGDYKLALQIAMENSNPFNIIMKLNDKVKVSKKDIINSYDEFLTYFF